MKNKRKLKENRGEEDKEVEEKLGVNREERKKKKEKIEFKLKGN